MNALQLFYASPTYTEPDQKSTASYEPPKWRATDPKTSEAAAVAVKPGNDELVRTIRDVVRLAEQPISAFEIAYRVSQIDEFRWSGATIRTAVSRAGLHAVDTDGVSDRGRKCLRYVLSERA